MKRGSWIMVCGVMLGLLTQPLTAGQYAYDGDRGQELTVLHIDGETLTGIAARLGWSCELAEQRGGHTIAPASVWGRDQPMLGVNKQPKA
jgi:hypothetical protein